MNFSMYFTSVKNFSDFKIKLRKFLTVKNNKIIKFIDKSHFF